MDHYDINGIIGEAIRCGIDITPTDRQEWKMFCCACKVLGVDEFSFVALSSLHGTPEKESRRAWRDERSPQRYKNHDQAAAMVVAFAKSAGVEVKRFLLSPYRVEQRPTRHRPAPRIATAPRPSVPAEKPAPVYISPDMIRATETHAKETTLYKFLSGEFEAVEVERVFALYHIGGTSFAPAPEGRAASLPYINAAGRCVDCKLQQYDPNTGSRKGRPISWALAQMKQNEHRAAWCNFGDHLLTKYPAAPVFIVESEKTALICAIVYPGRVWIAAGSMQNLTPERCAAYRGRVVTLCPDRDGWSLWREKAERLAADGLAVSVDTTITRHPGAPKDDLADVILRHRHGTQQPPTTTREKERPPDPRRVEAERVFEIMKATHPGLKELAAKLELTPISVEPYNQNNKN